MEYMKKDKNERKLRKELYWQNVKQMAKSIRVYFSYICFFVYPLLWLWWHRDLTAIMKMCFCVY